MKDEPRHTDHDAALAGASVLIVDDEPGMRNFLTKTLRPHVRHVAEASSPAEADRQLDAGCFDLVVLDNVMPGERGLDWLARQRRKGFYADVVLITAYADLDTAIAALRAGVSDFVLKPFRANQILAALARTLDAQTLRRDNALMRRELEADGQPARLMGRSPAIAQVCDLLDRLAPLSTPVLFTGPSGSGKELAARQLHALSTRGDRPFVAVNAAALTPDRVAADLFGTVQADGTVQAGLLQLANGGALFLDEIAQLPEQAQAALLRVLEDHRIRPLGGEREVALNLRFLFATNADLPRAVAEGRFRPDLWHRINVVQIAMPALRDRPEDIVDLAVHFAAHFARRLGMAPPALDDRTLAQMVRYDWPGNVRELRNLMERSVILGALPPGFEGGGAVTGAQAVEDLELVTQRHILRVLDACAGNRAEAARRLGVSRKTVDRKLAAWAQEESGAG